LCGVPLGFFGDSKFNASTCFAPKPLPHGYMATPTSSALHKPILNLLLVTNMTLQYSGEVEMGIYAL